MTKAEKEKYAELEAENAELKEQLKVSNPRDTPHELLDASIKYFKDNSFNMRGVDSHRILSMVRSAREALRTATLK